jgi:hypothetical protein
MRKKAYKGVPLLEGGQLEVFYCLSAFEVWLDKRVFFGKGVSLL